MRQQLPASALQSIHLFPHRVGDSADEAAFPSWRLGRYAFALDPRIQSAFSRCWNGLNRQGTVKYPEGRVLLASPSIAVCIPPPRPTTI